MNSVLYYPAVFQKEKDGYSVWVPDIAGCTSQGDTFGEAMQYISEAIGLCIEFLLDNGDSLPVPSDPVDLVVENDQFVVIVSFDFDEYQKKHGSKAVKKTLTIPAWLNTLSEQNNINFSQVLQAGLIKALHITE